MALCHYLHDWRLHAAVERGHLGLPQQSHQYHPLHPHQQRRQDQHQSRFSIQRQLENEINEIKRVNNKQDHNHLNACLSLLIKDKYLRHMLNVKYSILYKHYI